MHIAQSLRNNFKSNNGWLIHPLADILLLNFGVLLIGVFTLDFAFGGYSIENTIWAEIRPKWIWLVVIETHLMAPYVIIFLRPDLRAHCLQRKLTFIWIPLAIYLAIVGVFHISISNELFRTIGNQRFLFLWTIPLVLFEMRHFSAQNYGILSLYRKSGPEEGQTLEMQKQARSADKIFITLNMLILLPLAWLFFGSNKFYIFGVDTTWTHENLGSIQLAAVAVFTWYAWKMMESKSLTVPRILFSVVILFQVFLATLIHQKYSGIMFIVPHCIAAIAISTLALRGSHDGGKSNSGGASIAKGSLLFSLGILVLGGFTYLFVYKLYLVEPRISCRGSFTDMNYGTGALFHSNLASSVWWGFLLWLYVMHYYYESFLYRSSSPVSTDLKKQFSISDDRI